MKRRLPRPESVKIGAHQFPVKWGYIESDEHPWLFGLTTSKDTTIHINDVDVSRSQIRDTLLHECMHGICVDLNLNFADGEEEQIIRGFTPWLLMLLRDNPDVVAFLLEED